jgi:putative membrane protein
MSSYRNLALASALALAVACGNAPDGEREGGGGADGFGDDARPTPAERTGATGDSGRGMRALSETERIFVEKVSLSNQMEVTLGNLAEDKAGSEEVSDHEGANRDLQSSLGGDAIRAPRPGVTSSSNQSKNTPPPGAAAEIATMHQQIEQTRHMLEGLSGAAFDRAYLQEMVEHHEKDVQEFERAVQSGNAQLRAFAERTLPTLRRHLQQARQLQQSIR